MTITYTSGNFAVLNPPATSGVSRSDAYYREFVSCEDRIEVLINTADVEQGEARPTAQAVSQITNLVQVASRDVPFPSSVDVSVFFGEALVTWKYGQRQVTVLSSGNPNDPKILMYEGGPAQPSQSKIYPGAAAENLRDSIQWLYR